MQHAQRQELAVWPDAGEDALDSSPADREGQRDGRRRAARNQRRALGRVRRRPGQQHLLHRCGGRGRCRQGGGRAGQAHAAPEAHPLAVCGMGGSVAESASSATGV